MLVDIHVHTLPYSPCSLLRRAELLALALERGIEALIVTEHERLWERDELRELQAEFQAQGVLLLNGAELVSDIGHVLVYGASELPLGTADPAAMVRCVHDQGGVAVLAHPFRYGRLQAASPSELAALFGPFDAIEVLNGNLSPAEVARGLKARCCVVFTPVAGSDAHSAGMVGRYLTETPPLSSLADFLEAVRRARVRPIVNPLFPAD